MQFKDRMRKKRKEREMTLEEVATIVGVTRQTVQKYESGVVTNIPSDKIELIATALRTTPSYLMGWEEDTLNIDDIPNLEPMPDTEKKPLLGTIACGEPILAEENIEDYVNVPKVIKCDFLLACKGNSMINLRVYDGDLVCVKQQPTVENGEVAAILIDDEATLKRFNQYGDTVVLKAENPDFPDIVLKESDAKEIKIIGKATHYISKIK